MSEFGFAARKLTADGAENWSRVGDGEIFVSDIIDQAREPEAKTESWRYSTGGLMPGGPALWGRH